MLRKPTQEIKLFKFLLFKKKYMLRYSNDILRSASVTNIYKSKLAKNAF